jgi:hypothetical protein
MLASAVNLPARSICKCQLPVHKVGMDLLHDTQLNKGTAFTKEERDRLHLRGLLPPKVFTKDEQAARIRRQFELMPTPLLKYIFLSNEREKNEESFWRFLFTYPPTKQCQFFTPQQLVKFAKSGLHTELHTEVSTSHQTITVRSKISLETTQDKTSDALSLQMVVEFSVLVILVLLALVSQSVSLCFTLLLVKSHHK